MNPWNKTGEQIIVTPPLTQTSFSVSLFFCFPGSLFLYENMLATLDCKDPKIQQGHMQSIVPPHCSLFTVGSKKGFKKSFKVFQCLKISSRS